MFLKIRLAKNSDAKIIFDLSNDKLVRVNSFNSMQILWEEHVKWFSEKLNNQNCIFYLVVDDKDNFVGQVRFDKIKEENSFIVSISLSVDFRGKGLALQVLQIAMDELSKVHTFKFLYANIKEENTSSLKLFLKAGYKIFKKESTKDFQFFRLRYS